MSDEEVQVEDIPMPLGEKKTEEQTQAHAVAAAKVDAPMLELVMPVGMETVVKSIPLEVVKVDGMTVTFKRKDIVG